MDCAKVMWLMVTSLLFLLQSYKLSEGSPCGFPGTPAYGYVKPDRDLYEEEAVVTYSCRVGYILLGVPIRRCLKDGTWTEEIPICDDSMTTLGVAFSTASVPGHPAEMAIDRDKESCTYLKPKKLRWWRIDLGGKHKVLSVAVTIVSTDKYFKFTVFVINIQGTNAFYYRCASFSGKFGSQTIVLSCAEGKGIEGHRVHLEDHRKLEGLFEICEVEVQVEKDAGYDCGRPDRQPNSITYDHEDDEVNYDCVTGYELMGEARRFCEMSGQWSGEAPICEPIVCDGLEPLENGELYLTAINGNTPLEGTTVVHSCDEGYKLEGDFTRLCLKDGSWSGRPPKCKAIRCPAVDGKKLGGIYRLVNKTTRMGSMAMLKCRRGVKMEGDNPYITCTEEGKWTEPEASCILPPGAARSEESKQEPVIKNHGAVIFGMVVAVLIVLIVLISFFVVKRRRDSRKPALPSRHYELVPPPRPPPRTKGLKSTIIDLVGRDSVPGKYLDSTNQSCDWKTRSLPLASAPKDDGYEEVGAARRTLSYDDTSKLKLHEKHESAPTGQATTEPPAEEKEESTEEKEPAKDEVATATTPTEKVGGAYAAVDYDKKRQSRLLKDQDSQERSRPTSPAGNIQLRELPPIPPDNEMRPTDNEVRLSPPSSPMKNEERKDEDEESEESEDVSLPIQPSDSQTSGAPTPSPDVVVDVQVDGFPGRSSTSTPEERPARRTRGRLTDQQRAEEPVESPPRRTRARATDQQRAEEPAESPTSRSTQDERPARRTRTRGVDQPSPEEQVESTPDASTTSPSEERPTRRTRPTTSDRPDFRSALQPTNRRRF